MNEHKEKTGFYLVLPSTSSDEIFLENHTGRFTVLLPKEIHLDEEFHWEMALVELFWPNKILCQSVKICGTRYKSQKGNGKERTFQLLCFTV